MPVTDILNPTTVLTNNAAVSSANALAVKVISGGGSGITVNTTTITGGTTTRLLYDNGGTVGETAALTYASGTAILSLLGTMTLGSAVATGFTLDGSTDSQLTLRNRANNGDANFHASNITGGGFVIAGGGQALGFFGGPLFVSSVSGTLNLTNGALDTGIGWDFSTDAVFKIRTRVQSADAAIAAGNGTLSGTLTYGGVTFASTVTGSGSLVGGTNPTLSSLVATGTSSFAVTNHSGLATFSSAMVYGGVTLASTVTGTGSMVLSASPTLSGTASFAATVHSGLATFSSAQTTVGTGTFQNAVAASASVVSTGILFSSTASFGVIWGALGSVAPTLAVTQGTLLINTSGSSIASRMFIRTSSSWTSITTAG